MRSACGSPLWIPTATAFLYDRPAGRRVIEHGDARRHPAGMDDRDVEAFERARPALMGLAYRILGSLSDAEDVVQDCFLKWRDAERATIATPASWLSTVCTRRCLDLLR